MPENTTNAAEAATLTQKELWSKFAHSHITHKSNLGYVVRDFRVNDYLLDCGEWGDFLDITERVADSVELSSDPGYELECLISDFESYITNLKSIHEEFESLKAISLVPFDRDDDEPDEKDDPKGNAEWNKAWREWEDNPRYALIGESASGDAQ